jgi:hypothetical protein
MQMKKGKIGELERQKNFFSITLFLIFLVLAWLTSWVVIFSSRYHHSLLFNPWGDKSSDNVYGTWICVVLHGLIIAVFWLANKLTWIAKKVSESASYKALTISRGDTEEQGSFTQILLQAAVPEEDIDEEYYGLEGVEEEGEEEPASGPETAPVCVGMLLRVLWRFSTERHAYRCVPDPSSICLVGLTSFFYRLFLQEPRSIDINPGSINPGPGDYLGVWTYKEDKGAPLEGPLLWRLNESKPVVFPPSQPQQTTPAPSNQGVTLSMPPPAAGENILQRQRSE